VLVQLYAGPLVKLFGKTAGLYALHFVTPFDSTALRRTFG